MDFLYHVTHVKNLDKIAKDGLLYRSLVQPNEPVDISNEEVQNIRKQKRDPIYNKELHDYVPLFFRTKNPMLYRLRERRNALAVLCIDLNILEREKTIFTDGNAASHNTKFFASLEHLENLDWECLDAHYWTEFGEDSNRKRSAEVLVYKKIPQRSIMEVAVSNGCALDAWELGSLTWRVNIREDLFF